MTDFPFLPIQFFIASYTPSDLDFTNQVFASCYCCGSLDVDSRDILKGGIKYEKKER